MPLLVFIPQSPSAPSTPTLLLDASGRGGVGGQEMDLESPWATGRQQAGILKEPLRAHRSGVQRIPLSNAALSTAADQKKGHRKPYADPTHLPPHGRAQETTGGDRFPEKQPRTHEVLLRPYRRVDVFINSPRADSGVLSTNA